MRTSLGLSLAAFIACSAPTLEGSPTTEGVRERGREGGEGEGGRGGELAFSADGGKPTSASGAGSDPDSHARPASADGGGARGGPSGDGAGLPDTDGDGVPDPFDCDPQSNTLGALIVQDDLATAQGVIEAAPGFDPSAWIHGGGGYRQEQLRNASDASFFKIEASPNLVLDVRATSTKTGTFAPTLHQDMVVVGASSQSGQFSAFGCGVEFVEGNDPMGVASIVHLDGPIGAIRTTAIKREGRPFLPTNEEFGINVRLQGGTLACTVVQGQTVTTVAANVGQVQGAIGFYTHQAASMFRSIRVCQI